VLQLLRKRELGRWAGQAEKVRGVRSLSFKKNPFSNSNFSNSFQTISKTFKTFETSNLHTKHYATKI
jgi:hypothetical protein